MPDSPLTRLIQLVGGAAMLQGPIGYQVLGNLLTAGARSPELAGVAAALAVGSHQRSTTAQVALRVIVPAVALLVLSEREAERLRRLAAEANARDRGVRAERAARRRERCREDLAELSAALEALAAQTECTLLRQKLETQAAELKALAATEQDELRTELEAGFEEREKNLLDRLATQTKAFNDAIKDAETLGSKNKELTTAMDFAAAQDENLRQKLSAGAEREKSLLVQLSKRAKAYEKALADEKTLRSETKALAAALRKASAERDKLAREAQVLRGRIDRLRAVQTGKGRAGQRAPSGRGPTERLVRGGESGSSDTSDTRGKATTRAGAPRSGPGDPPAKPRPPGARDD